MNRFWFAACAGLLISAGVAFAGPDRPLIVRVDWPTAPTSGAPALFGPRLSKFAAAPLPASSDVRIYWRTAPRGLPPGAILSLEYVDERGSTRIARRVARSALRGPQMTTFPCAVPRAPDVWQVRIAVGGRAVAEASSGAGR